MTYYFFSLHKIILICVKNKSKIQHANNLIHLKQHSLKNYITDLNYNTIL